MVTQEVVGQTDKTDVTGPISGLGASIKAWRELFGLSQAEVAERLDLHRTTIGNWEAGWIEHPQIVRFAYERLDAVVRNEQRWAWEQAHRSEFQQLWDDPWTMAGQPVGALLWGGGTHDASSLTTEVMQRIVMAMRNAYEAAAPARG